MIKATPSPLRQPEHGVALVTTVIVVAVLAVVAVAMMQSTTLDRTSSRSAMNYAQARATAEAGAAAAQSLLAESLTRYPDSVTVWQNIGGASPAGTNNEATVLYIRARADDTNLGALPSAFGPSVVLLAQPLVSREGSSPTVLSTNAVNLNSLAGLLPFDSNNMVNLNATNAARPNPFIGLRSSTNGGSQAPVAAAQWVYLTNSDGRTNARYAFWVEDESFKVNVNTVTNGIRSNGLGLGPTDARLDGSWASSSNSSLRNPDAAAAAIAARTNVGALPSARTAAPAVAAATRLDVAGADELAFLTTAYSAGLNVSRGGFKRFNLNNALTGIDGPTDTSDIRTSLNRIIATMTNSNSIPALGQRFYRTVNSAAGINSNVVTPSHAEIYLNKIAANLLDYIDADNQPTLVNNNTGFTVRVGAPSFAISGPNDSDDGPNTVAAIGQEAVPRLQEYAIHARLLKLDPIGVNTSRPNPATEAEFEFTIDHYFEFWNPSQRNLTAADLGNPFLKVHGQPAMSPNLVEPAIPEGRDFQFPIPTNAVFPAGGTVVVTTAPLDQLNGRLVPGNSTIISLTNPTGDQSHRRYTGKTKDRTNSIYAGFNSLFRIHMQSPREAGRPGSGTTDYGTGVLLGNGSGHLESFVGLPIVIDSGPALSLLVTNAAMLGGSDLYFARGGSLMGNANKSAGPISTAGDPRALNEQLEFLIYAASSFPSPEDQTRFFSSGLANNNVPANSSLGRPNDSYVNPTNWVDFSSQNSGTANAPLVLRNGPMQSIGELGHITDPARVPGTSGSLTNVIYSRGGGRTLRVGQPEHPRWFDGRQTNASRTWTSWRLADVFTVTNALKVDGLVNPNGALRDQGAAMRAALHGVRFQASPEGAPSLADRTLALSNFITNMIGRLTNASPAGLPGGAINAFWERGEISELSQLGNGTALAGVSMSNSFDRGREELVRRSIEMLTMRGSVFSVYVVAQSLQISGGSTNVLATARLRNTFEVTPQFPTQDTFNDSFNATNATRIARRFAQPISYQVRTLQSFHD
jgi:hypothetical protein